VPDGVSEDGTLCSAPLSPSLKIGPRSGEGAVPGIRMTLPLGLRSGFNVQPPFFGCGQHAERKVTVEGDGERVQKEKDSKTTLSFVSVIRRSSVHVLTLVYPPPRDLCPALSLFPHSNDIGEAATSPFPRSIMSPRSALVRLPCNVWEARTNIPP